MRIHRSVALWGPPRYVSARLEFVNYLWLSVEVLSGLGSDSPTEQPVVASGCVD